jgi:acetyltransferase EpsM
MSAPEPVIVVGGGEHARVVIDALLSCPGRFDLLGFVDPEPCAPTEALGVRWLGDDHVLLERDLGQVALVLGVGSAPGSTRRAEIVAHFASAGARWASVVHARAMVSPHATLDDGVVVLAGAVVNPGARVGAHAIVNSGAVVEHDVEIGAFTHVAPAAAIGGGARIGTHVTLGLGSRVRDHVTIGDHVVVGMGAAVVTDLPAGARVVGVPARPMEQA